MEACVLRVCEVAAGVCDYTGCCAKANKETQRKRNGYRYVCIGFGEYVCKCVWVWCGWVLCGWNESKNKTHLSSRWQFGATK